MSVDAIIRMQEKRMKKRAGHEALLKNCVDPFTSKNWI
jgi:hypothetical protein